MREIAAASWVSSSVHGTGVILFHGLQGRLFSGNRMGARIWAGLEQSLTPEAIALAISGDFRVPEALAREDTLRFIDELERHGLVERRMRA
jgi:hypothetical protein